MRRIEKKLNKAKRLAEEYGILQDNPNLTLIIWDEIRSANFRLAIIIGTNGILVALLLTVILIS